MPESARARVVQSNLAAGLAVEPIVSRVGGVLCRIAQAETDGERFPVGKSVKGPMVIEEPAATTVVFPDQRVKRDAYGFLHIERV